ncbi:MAG: hypothetical protein LBG92_06570 [Prevotellaceae bacterium]|jgi:hypothetical protein|nr:hypothetical protein [Prevotellaceae bacterium]
MIKFCQQTFNSIQNMYLQPVIIRDTAKVFPEISYFPVWRKRTAVRLSHVWKTDVQLNVFAQLRR